MRSSRWRSALCHRSSPAGALPTTLPDCSLGGIVGIAKVPHQLFEPLDTGIHVGIRDAGRLREPGPSSQVDISRSLEMILGLVADVAVDEIELDHQFVDPGQPFIERSLHLLGVTANEDVSHGMLGNGLVSHGLGHLSLNRSRCPGQGCVSWTSVGRAKRPEGVPAACHRGLTSRALRGASQRSDWGTFGPSPLGQRGIQ